MSMTSYIRKKPVVDGTGHVLIIGRVWLYILHNPFVHLSSLVGSNIFSNISFLVLKSLPSK